MPFGIQKYISFWNCTNNTLQKQANNFLYHGVKTAQSNSLSVSDVCATESDTQHNERKGLAKNWCQDNGALDCKFESELTPLKVFDMPCKTIFF